MGKIIAPCQLLQREAGSGALVIRVGWIPPVLQFIDLSYLK